MKIGELLKEHTHEGVKYPQGSRICVDDRQFHWLVSQGVMAPFPGLTVSDVTPPPVQRRIRHCCGW